MSFPTHTESSSADLIDLEPQVVATVRRWLGVAAALPVDRAATQLADMLSDDAGLAFTVGFVDGVIRPEDSRVAARNFARLAKRVPQFLPLHLRLAVRIGAAIGLVAPWLVVPIVRGALRRMVGHLVINARPRPLSAAIRRLRSTGAALNINLLGEAVLGAKEASRRLTGTERLLSRPDVDYVSIKVSSTVAPHSEWAFDETVEQVVESLTPLYRIAAGSSPAKFVNLDMEEYRDLELTVAVFTRLLELPEFQSLHAGIVLQAYLPDTLAIMTRLQDWAAERVRKGGAPVKVRVVKGANLPMEQVEAAVHGWPLATWSSKVETDAHFKRLLDYSLHPDRVANVRIGIAGHNLFDIAFAWLLAQQRGATKGVDFEMLLGMATSQAEAVRRDVGDLLLYTPVVHPREFDVAIAYLVRRLEEGASHDNFMSAVFNLHEQEQLFERERSRFSASLAMIDQLVLTSNRSQRLAVASGEFSNTPDTDPSVRASERWGRAILGRTAYSQLGVDLVSTAAVSTAAQLASRIATGRAAASGWAARSAPERATVLRAAAAALEERRADLIEVMVAECGKTIDQADPEVSEAVDFANYYAQLAEQLDEVDGAAPTPPVLTLATPPWNFPVAIPAGSVLAPLAAGSAVIVKPAPQAERCAAVMVNALHAAGVPDNVLQLVIVDEDVLGRELISDPGIDRLILTGAFETAELFRSFRPDLPLLAETSGKNAIVVTPSADLDLAVKDVVASAFGHAGQKCSAASLVILVGSVARSRRFRLQLLDAVRSLQIGPADDPRTRMGPLTAAASGKLLRALTELDPGERWLVEPRRLDDEGRLWTPGLKDGVRPGSDFHLIEYFGPVLGIMTAATLAEAIELQNAVPFGLTAGLHALDEAEVKMWLGRVQAGNLYVNRGITGAIVRRQPFGGWKRSAVGTGTKAGGPNYLIGLCDWTPAEAKEAAEMDTKQRALLGAAELTGVPDVERLRRALGSDAAAWRDEFGTARDVSGLGIERNVLRYVATPVLIRFTPDAEVEGGSGCLTDLVRVVSAGVRSKAKVEVSSPLGLSVGLARALTELGVAVVIEDDDEWHNRLATLRDARVRLVGGSTGGMFSATGGRPDIAFYDQPVTEAGRVEMLPFLREQAISITAHRFGTPNAMSADLLLCGSEGGQAIDPR